MLLGGESIDWNFELGLCERCADKSASNYHAWCHRQWVLQKSPPLLKYEPRLTEKFIRKHIGDYSGYNHRQHVLYQMLETGFYEIDCTDYAALSALVYTLTSQNAHTINELVAIILPDVDQASEDKDDRIKSFMYCMNVAAADLTFCQELRDIFGYREAFECHRKAVLKYIVDNCNDFNHSTELYQPKLKMCKVNRNTNNGSIFLEGLQVAEGKRGEHHRKWCHIFLNFEYSDSDDD